MPQDLGGHECLQYINLQDGPVFDWEFHRGMLALGFESLTTGGALVDLFPDWPDETFPLYATRPPRRLPPTAVEAFLDFCTEICLHHA